MIGKGKRLKEKKNWKIWEEGKNKESKK